MNLEYRDILLRHNKSVVSSRSECDTTIKLGKHTFAVPVVASNMKSILNREICELFDKENWFYVYHRIDGVEDVLDFVRWANVNLNTVSISVGVTQDWLDLLNKIHKENLRVDYITIDVALSFNDNVVPIIRVIQVCFPDTYLIVGNGSTSEWAKWLESLRVDCIKVGIGVSQACRTRQYTGFGSTTVGSLEECVCNTSSVKIMSDGGITIQDGVVCIGDVAKALVIGADIVMSGALFSRCIDSPALKEGYYGNASKYAKKHSNHIEGELLRVESNGLTIKEMMKLIQDSLKSSISYSGGKNIAEMKKLTGYEILK